MKEKKDNHIPYYELEDALRKRECPICWLSERSVKRYFDDLFYEKVNDAGVARKLNESLGFCRQHSKQIAETGEALGIAIIYKRLVEHIVKHLKNSIKPIKFDACPAHAIYADTEKRYLSLLAQHWNDLKGAFQCGAMLCIPHFYRAISIFKQKKELQELRDFQINNLMMLSEELEEFSRKHDYRYKDETWGREKDSWQRAVSFIFSNISG